MSGDLLVIAVVLVLGITAFVFGLVNTVWRGFCFIVGSVFGRRKASGGGRLVCPREGCRKVEYRDAVYCSQCGEQLVRRRG
jgi:hypothetical protein